MSERRHLGSTYRLQLNGLGFAGATALVPFLHGLGVETCYVSPITRARAGSSHGYDVVDPTVLGPSLGPPEAFEALLVALSAHGMGLLVDIVPNHMAASVENPFFADVLRRGQGSEFAAYFDIAWDEQNGKILLPVLGKSLALVVGAGEIRVEPGDESSEPAIAYFEHRFPVAAGSVRDDVAQTLANQHYVLADWRVANREVNYRRFFDINELIGVRQEDPRVFADTHRLVAELAADPRVAGFRVDHVDGLRDPGAYLSMLRDLTGLTAPEPVILVEKIVAGAEALPDWPVEGTTGYEFADLVVGLFIDEAGAEAFARAAAAATGDRRSFAERATGARRRVLDTLFPHQLDQVAAAFDRALDDDAGGARTDVRLAIRELTTYLEVYRTYRRPGEVVRGDDVARLQAAADRAWAGLSNAAANVLDRVVLVVSGDMAAGSAAWEATAAWQQLSGPVAAKGVEDTAMYDSGHLLALADVGADPDRPAASNERFHAAMVARRRDAPAALSSTSTHDSKRSHDVRCRLAVLSELAAEWDSTVDAIDRQVLGAPATAGPDRADRRYLYETLVGAWPPSGEVGDDFVARIQAYLVKAAREAKRHSSWLEPVAGYEEALSELARRIILGKPAESRRLIEATVAGVACAGATNSLSSVVLKASAPGVPDFYQGDDAWFFALVDPDNRAPLDAAAHAELLSQLPPTSDAADHSAAVATLLDDWRTGAVKQLVVRNSLEVRRRHAELFALGRYQPLEVVGERREHVLAFARVHEARTAITVVPRGVYSLSGPARFPVGAEIWGDTGVVFPRARGRALTDALTGRTMPVTNDQIALGDAMATLPVALLVS